MFIQQETFFLFLIKLWLKKNIVPLVVKLKELLNVPGIQKNSVKNWDTVKTKHIVWVTGILLIDFKNRNPHKSPLLNMGKIHMNDLFDHLVAIIKILIVKSFDLSPGANLHSLR